jgi:hypothetical protein
MEIQITTEKGSVTGTTTYYASLNMYELKGFEHTGYGVTPGEAVQAMFSNLQAEYNKLNQLEDVLLSYEGKTRKRGLSEILVGNETSSTI